jgi:hypothetical protein
VRQNDPTQISDVKGLACRSALDPHADSQSVFNSAQSRHFQEYVPRKMINSSS